MTCSHQRIDINPRNISTSRYFCRLSPVLQMSPSDSGFGGSTVGRVNNINANHLKSCNSHQKPSIPRMEPSISSGLKVRSVSPYLISWFLSLMRWDALIIHNTGSPSRSRSYWSLEPYPSIAARLELYETERNKAHEPEKSLSRLKRSNSIPYHS